jgi:hypothetical protein
MRGYMKTYLVIEFNDGKDFRVVDVYATKKGAIEKVTRMANTNRTNLKKVTTFEEGSRSVHIITKSVKGLAGIKFEIDGKKRFLTGTIKNEE